MYPIELDFCCKTFGKKVIASVYYTTTRLFPNAKIPTRVECSGSPNGECGKNNICPVLKAAENKVRYGNF